MGDIIQFTIQFDIAAKGAIFLAQIGPKTLDNIDWQPDNFMWLIAHKAKVT